MCSPHSPKQNHFLAALPAADYARLLPDLELIPMPLGWALYESGDQMDYVYFPTTSVVSLFYVMENGDTSQSAIAGNEGLVGVSLFMGGDSTPSWAVVQSAGHGYQLRASVLKREFALGSALQRLALRYTQVLITQIMQTAVCNRHHSLRQRLCRTLLSCADGLESDELVITQELIANMLGVRREGVAGAAHQLQADGLIQYRRGHIRILNRANLEKLACECYEVVRAELNRLLPYKDHDQSAAIRLPLRSRASRLHQRLRGNEILNQRVASAA